MDYYDNQFCAGCMMSPCRCSENDRARVRQDRIDAVNEQRRYETASRVLAAMCAAVTETDHRRGGDGTQTWSRLDKWDAARYADVAVAAADALRAALARPEDRPREEA